MKCLREGHPPEVALDLSARVAGTALHIVFAQILADLEAGEDRRIIGLGNGDGVTNVVGMAVRDGDKLALDLVGRHRRDGIVRQERVLLL